MNKGDIVAIVMFTLAVLPMALTLWLMVLRAILDLWQSWKRRS